jgi:hypothetical protein
MMPVDAEDKFMSIDTTRPNKLPEAGAFRELRKAFAAMQLFPEPDDAHQILEKQLRQVRELIELHPDAFWRARLHQAVEAVKLGEEEVLLLRFPHASCTDAGHAINVGNADWPATLTGEAARLYAVWQTQFHPQGFGMVARIMEYPHNNMGDAGLFLSWQEDEEGGGRS